MIDKTIIDDLIVDVGADTVLIVLDTFLESFNIEMKILSNPDNYTPEDVRRAAHTLKGSSATVGLANASKIALQIEQNMKHKQIYPTARDLAELSEATLSELAELKEYIKE